MKTFSDLSAWRDHRRNLGDGAVGLVPTMGALHAGHESLVRTSLAHDRHTVVSIFVNPAQFDRPDDLAAYPRTLESDLEALERWGVDTVLTPEAGALYPDGYRFRVSESKFSKRFCGAHRPGHSDGVLTVVMKLFNLVEPERAYFGEKDWQQLQLIRDMVEAFCMDIDVVACPIVREADGLALSSRNQRLDAGQRLRAPELYRALVESKNAAEAAARLRQAGFTVDYVEDYKGRRLAAASLGAVRLIDNMALES